MSALLLAEQQCSKLIDVELPLGGLLIEPVVPALDIIVGPDGLKCRPTADWPQPAAHSRFINVTRRRRRLSTLPGITSHSRCLKGDGMCSAGSRGELLSFINTGVSIHLKVQPTNINC